MTAMTLLVVVRHSQASQQAKLYLCTSTGHHIRPHYHNGTAGWIGTVWKQNCVVGHTGL